MTQYIYMIRPINHGASARGEVDQQTADTMKAHFGYLKSATESGKVLLAGRCEDTTYGIIIFDAESEEDAQSFMENDPAVKGGVMNAELKLFRVALQRDS